MIYLTLFVRFFLTGLMAVGGGLATLPFLQEIGHDTGWFTSMDLANMIAVSESTPGPMGVNMATYVGYHVGSEHYGVLGGILGGTVATLSLILPSLIVILIVVRVLDAFKESRLVQAIFRGLRGGHRRIFLCSADPLLCHFVFRHEKMEAAPHCLYLHCRCGGCGAGPVRPGGCVYI